MVSTNGAAAAALSSCAIESMALMPPDQEEPCNEPACGKPPPSGGRLTSEEMAAMMRTHNDMLMQRLDSWMLVQEQRIERVLWRSNSQNFVKELTSQVAGSPKKNLHGSDTADFSTGITLSNGHHAGAEESSCSSHGEPPKEKESSSSRPSLTSAPWMQGRSMIFKDDPADRREGGLVDTIQHVGRTCITLPRLVCHRTIEYFRNSTLSAFVASPVFEGFCAWSIVVNLAMIGLEVQHLATHPGVSHSPIGYLVVQTFSASVFIFEVVLRVLAEKSNFCTSKNWAWNWFDMILVSFSIAEVMVELLRVTVGSMVEANNALSNVRIMRIIRFFRITRIFRIARIVRFVHALSVLVFSIMLTLRSLVWALMLLMVIMYFFAILFTQAATDHIVSMAAECENPTEENMFDGVSICDALQNYWGTIPSSVFTLFASITGGLDWERPSAALRLVDTIWLWVFICFISFSYFAVLNVITGVFCQSAIESAQQDRELRLQDLHKNKHLYIETIQEQFDMIRQLFGASVGKAKSVTITEFEKHLDNPQVQAYFSLLDLDTSDVVMLFRLLDHDGTMEVDAEAFVDGCLRLKGCARSIDLAKLTFDTKHLSKRMSRHIHAMDAKLAKLSNSVAGVAAAVPLLANGFDPPKKAIAAFGEGLTLAC